MSEIRKPTVTSAQIEMDWTSKRVVVTGADGFIGSHLSDALARAGAEVTALALYNSFDSAGWLDDLDADARADIQIIRGDIRDAWQMQSLCEGADTVFHLAALIAIPFSYAAPASYVATNVTGTVNVLNACRAAGVRRVIHTSTSEVYGSAQVTPIPETHPLQGQSPYSASKIGADMMAESFFRSFELPVVTLRPFNTYGPRQSERAVIPTVIRQALDPACPDIRIGDRTPERDFNFVDDTVSAFLAAAAMDEAQLGKTFNAGSGRMVTIGETVDLIASITGANKEIVTETARKRPAKSEVMALMADASALRAASGWQPQTSLEDGLAATVEWWRTRIASGIRPGRDYMT